MYLYMGRLALSLYQSMRAGLSPGWEELGVQLQGTATPSPITPTTSCFTTEQNMVNNLCSIQGHVTSLDELVIVYVRVISEAFGLGQLVCQVENRGQERQEHQHLLHWSFCRKQAIWIKQPHHLKSKYLLDPTHKRKIFLFFSGIQVLSDPIFHDFVSQIVGFSLFIVIISQ